MARTRKLYDLLAISRLSVRRMSLSGGAGAGGDIGTLSYCVDEFGKVLHIRGKIDIIVADDRSLCLTYCPVECRSPSEALVAVQQPDPGGEILRTPHKGCAPICTPVLGDNTSNSSVI